MSAPKQYGLILPGQQQKKPIVPQREYTKPSIFDESDDSGEELPPHMQMPAKKPVHGPGIMEERLAKRLQEKALKEDPTVFLYDELYDAMENKREEEKQSKSNAPKKPKYIGKLMECAERRKLENELRVERQVQKEREQEGEEFKDKESFVTAAYRKKLEEMRKLEEQEKRDEYLEAIGDVTKQKDLDGFYRHLYEQKLGTGKEVQKPPLPSTTSTGDDDIAYKPIKSGKPQQQQRAYRKRKSSEDEEPEATPAADNASAEAKKMHLHNNIDADSDFSIDSSSDDDEDTQTKDKQTKDGETRNSNKQVDGTTTKPNVELPDSKTVALNLDKVKVEQVAGPKEATSPQMPPPPSSSPSPSPSPLTPTTEPPKPKKDKTQIWKKRTVGEAYDAAVQRYYERKAARSA